MSARRDISSTLKLVAIGLILFVGYQTWFKPTYRSPVPSLERPSPTDTVPHLPGFSRPEAKTNPPWDVPLSRLVELGPAPTPRLGRIRDELDRGNYEEAERLLGQLSLKKSTKMATRRFVAGMWNNLGVQQEKFGGTALSLNAFEQSVKWESKGPLAHLNLTQAYWEQRDPKMTVQFLETVIRLAPQDSFPHLALADLLLGLGDIDLATKHLELARPRAEQDPNHRFYLQKLMSKAIAQDSLRSSNAHSTGLPLPSASDIAMVPAPTVDQPPASSSALATQKSPVGEPPAHLPQPQPAQPRAEHFTVTWDGQAAPATWTRMRAILEYAHEELTQKFGHVPSKPIVVVLHTNQKFVSDAGSPSWADSLFDRSSGVIHLPTQGALEDLAVFSRVARHEFVHALLYEHVKGRISGVPNWLAEGLALQLAEDSWPDVENTEQKPDSLLPLTSLEGDWKAIPGNLFGTAYLTARSATQNLVDRYSMYGVRQIINLLRSGRSLDAAMRQKLFISYDQFQYEWEQGRRSSMKSAGS